ncbi:MAG: hypothetical protein V8R27_05195 [Oscillospiraceae bacterium]
MPLSGDEESTASQRIDWISYDASGLAAKALSTYHAVEDGWYLRLPEGWAENIPGGPYLRRGGDRCDVLC